MIRLAYISLLQCLLNLFCNQATSQVTGYFNDYRHVDSFVQTVRYQDDYIRLANDLGDPFPSDIEKMRAIFKWITNNIAFDYRFINSGKEVNKPDCSGDYDCIMELQAWENNSIKRILKNRRAISDGYARLFQRLCELNHLQSELIVGYARTKPYQIGNRLSANHTWNAVQLDSSWYFLDVTWAAGYCVEDDNGRLLRFVKDFREYYWLNDFDRFSRNHFPKNNLWSAMYRTSLEDFLNKPHYYSAEILQNIKEEQPSTGVLTIRKLDTLKFSFRYKKDITKIQLNSNIFRNPPLWIRVPVSKRKTRLVKDSWAEKKQVFIPFQRSGDRYSFTYVVNDMALYYLEVVLDEKKALRYKISVTK